MVRDILTATGLLSVLWFLIQRLSPELCEWRSNELAAWAYATRQTERRIVLVWRLHWRTYRERKAVVCL